MTADETANELVYDAWNRLVQVKDSLGVPIAVYAVDALGRRISELHGSDLREQFYSAAWQVLEERRRKRGRDSNLHDGGLSVA